MEILNKRGKDSLAHVYLAKTSSGKLIEFAESLQPPLPIEKKWVLIISTLYGCPVKCKICDAGNYYYGRLPEEDIFEQIDFLVSNRYPDKFIPVEKFKIQFSRMGEPSFNYNVLNVLRKFPYVYKAPGFNPSISTIFPKGTIKFFNELIEIKKNLYPETFQFQFSIHSTDTQYRNWLLPVKKYSFEEMAEYGDKFYWENGKKITLNFVVFESNPIDANILLKYFSTEKYLVKITPLNPTYNAVKVGFNTQVDFDRYTTVAKEIENAGYEVIVSIGELEENNIGSNCGQLVHAFNNDIKLNDAYTYQPEINLI